MRLSLGLLAAACAAHAAGATPVDDIVARARAASIVVIGEIHDNPEHHAVQARIVQALQPAALVFEMIPQADEDDVNALREQGASREAIAEALDWEETGWPDFGGYADILDAAPGARVFGAGQPLADVRRAVEEGAAAAFGPDAALYGLDHPLPAAEQALREAQQDAAHCGKLLADRLAGMVEAQRFRDAGLADAALWARTMTGDGQVVVIAGSGHADRQKGMPALLATADPELTVFSIGQLEAPAGPSDSFDAVLLAPSPDRDDPCARIGAPG